MKSFLFALLLITGPALAQNPDDFRGGWMTEIKGDRHIYQFVIQEGIVTGVFCNKDCTDSNNLAFVDDGTLSEGQLRFSLYSETATGEETIQAFSAELNDTELHISRVDSNSNSNIKPNTKPIVFQRSPVVDNVPSAPPGGFVPVRRTYEPPAPLINVTNQRVIGLWLAGNGPGRQHFIFKAHRGGLRGMVCGPCFDASNMAPLENIKLDGTSLYFDIVHENSGPGISEHGPHVNITRAVISKNEMHLWVVPGFEDLQSFTPIEMTLLGPVIYQGR